jgi:hypothetical protein
MAEARFSMNTMNAMTVGLWAGVTLLCIAIMHYYRIDYGSISTGG